MYAFKFYNWRLEPGLFGGTKFRKCYEVHFSEHSFYYFYLFAGMTTLECELMCSIHPLAF